MLIYLADVDPSLLSKDLLVKLQQASDFAGIDFTITSGFRPGVNGVDNGICNGPHMSHKAVDLRCHDSVSRFKIRYGLIKAGFKRIGQNSIHLHADICTLAEDEKPENVDWIEREP